MYHSGGITSDESQNKHTKFLAELAKFAIDNGADVNVNNEGATPLDMAQDPNLIALLKSRGAKCSHINIEEIVQGGLELALFNPSIIIEQKYKHLDATRSEEAKMPYIVHHIWLTSEDKPREIREQGLKIAFDTKDTFAKAPVSWEHIVWTNDKNLIPESVKNLEDHGIKVRSIYDYKDELSSFKIIEELVAKSKWGMASDTLRYSLVEKFGGVYADLNFIFNRDMTDEVHKYNFFTKTYGEHYIDNFFFGASEHHPVVAKMVELVERNLVTPPNYLSSINQDSRTLTDMGTANPTFLAYYKEANKNGNIDVVYPMTKRDGYDYDYNSIYRTEDRSVVRIEFRDYFDEEYMQRHIELTKDKCPKQQIYTDFLRYIHDHEICGAEIFNIGHDSKDGQTWLT